MKIKLIIYGMICFACGILVHHILEFEPEFKFTELVPQNVIGNHISIDKFDANAGFSGVLLNFDGIPFLGALKAERDAVEFDYEISILGWGNEESVKFARFLFNNGKVSEIRCTDSKSTVATLFDADMECTAQTKCNYQGNVTEAYYDLDSNVSFDLFRRTHKEGYYDYYIWYAGQWLEVNSIKQDWRSAIRKVDSLEVSYVFDGGQWKKLK